MNGNNANNDFEGGLGEDWLFGNGGNDLLFAGAGSDHVRGGDGDDLIEGGTGSDTLTGDAGADIFVFRAGDGGPTSSRTSCREPTRSRSRLRRPAVRRRRQAGVWNIGFTNSRGTVRSAEFANLDSGDQLAYDYITHSSTRSIRVFINGQVANYNPELIATIQYDDAASRHVSTVDFMVV